MDEKTRKRQLVAGQQGKSGGGLYSHVKQHLRSVSAQPKPPAPEPSILKQMRDAKSKLKPVEKFQQRYIVSPHNDVGNLFANTVGMSAFGIEQGMKAIRPVFKDQKQREAFATQVNTALSTEKDQHRLAALNQLKTWSSVDSAMTDFSSINKKRGAPIVYTQGHGEYGDTNIYSNTNEVASANKVGQMLHTMGLPENSEVRANSCFSGTQHKLNETMPDIYQHFKQQTMEFHHAGNWSQTFAGALQTKLRSFFGRKNRVAGYMGPTGQGSEPVKKIVMGGSVQKRQGVATDIGHDPHLRAQMRRRDPSYKE